jgi:hypothetical protein
MKPLKLRLFSISVCTSVLFMSTSSSAQDGPISPQEIKANWVGKTIIGTVASGPSAGKPIEFSMSADGTSVVSGAAVDSGTWRLSDQGYCATWKKIRSGQERCFTVVRKGAEYHVINPDGSVNTAVAQIR